MTDTGSIFNIMRYSTKDGPGLRTTVFLKGCPLSCLWCHNPESQTLEPEFIFHKSYCINCGSCAEYCPQDAITMSESGPEFPNEACTRCQGCVDQCPGDAREFFGQTLSVAELMKEILKDRIFYDDSSGGVTFSGGEPLSQPDFLKSLCIACKREDISVAIDTTLHSPWKIIEELMPLVDLWLVDLKIFDSEEHQQMTGHSNSRIIKNLKRLDRRKASIIVRMPIVPQMTDKLYDLRNRALFLQTLQNLIRVELLPYHSMAAGKLEAMNRQNNQSGFTRPSTRLMLSVQTILQEHRIPVAEIQE